MVKKILAALLAAAMIFSLVACTSTPAETQATEKTEAATTKATEAETTKAAETDAPETDAPAPAGDKVKITIFRCLYNRSAVDDAQVKKVQDAINARLDELGEAVEIEIHEISSSEYSDKVTMALAGGEINLLWNASWWGGGIGCDDLWRTNAAYDITDLLPGTLLWDAMPEGVWEASKYDGKVLFTPVYKETYEGYDMKTPKAVVELTGHDPEFPEVTSQDNWYDRMAAFDTYFQECLDNGVEFPYMACQFFYRIALDDYDFFGGSSSLLAVDRKTDTVVNAVASEGYKKWVHLMRDWYDKGYINDAILDKSTPQGLNKTANWGLQFWTNVPGDSLKNSETRDEQEEVMIEGITKWWTHSTTTLGSCFTVTSACSEEQAKACVAFMGRLYTDQKIADLYTYGIEGEDYTIEDGVVVVNNDGTYCHSAWESTSVVPLTLMAGEPVDKVQSYVDHNNAAETSCAAGFRFDKSAVEAEWTACQDLNSKYGEPLELGSPVVNDIEDVDAIIDAYLAELETVGYQKVLDEATKQYEAWKALK
jgi:putative aldouronate transport system substrate-binding protein